MHHVASEHGAHWLYEGGGSMTEAQWQAQQTNAQEWKFFEKSTPTYNVHVNLLTKDQWLQLHTPCYTKWNRWKNFRNNTGGSPISRFFGTARKKRVTGKSHVKEEHCTVLTGTTKSITTLERILFNKLQYGKTIHCRKPRYRKTPLYFQNRNKANALALNRI